MANKLRFERGEVKYHFDVFKDLYAKIDLDDDDKVTLEEMLTFERDRLKEYDDLVISIYWIGYSVTEDLLKQYPPLQKSFNKEFMLENRSEESLVYPNF